MVIKVLVDFLAQGSKMTSKIIYTSTRASFSSHKKCALLPLFIANSYIELEKEVSQYGFYHDVFFCSQLKCRMVNVSVHRDLHCC